MAIGVDLTGKQFHNLKVIEQAPSTIKNYKKNGSPVKQRMWRCLCGCGNTAIISASNLTLGHTKSCGCFKKILRNPESLFKRKYGSYISGAKTRGLDFLLSKEEVRKLFKGNCYYCDSMPKTIYTLKLKFNTHTFTYNGIDRIDSTKGYIEGNVVSCCKICNRAKSDMSYHEFVGWIKGVSIRAKEL